MISTPLYGSQLSQEWTEWVETPNKNGTRESEIFPFIKKWISDINPKNLLDIGCGQGICSTLIKKEINYIGIDISNNLINRAKKLYENENKNFKIGDVYSLPIDDKSIDAAMSIWVWSHLENLEKAATEIFRVLKPNGKYLIITANPETFEFRKTFYENYEIKGKLLTGNFDLGHGKKLTNSTLYLYTLANIKNALTKSGLKINYESRMGQIKECPKGLYVVLSGSK